MRLINVKTGRLEQFHGSRPPYAILSHTWGADEEEISFQDLESGAISKPGFGKFKLERCCQQAMEDGLDYAWIDTCCIDKTNSVELGEAINSMYRWYQGASTCYAFLVDVSSDDGTAHLTAFRESLWFTRGWTLQELLAPKDVAFYDKDWIYMGSKTQLAEIVEDVTKIPRRFLLGHEDLHDASIAQRMSWAAGRATKRIEDIAYCLLGIFNVSMGMIYGEGDRAFLRLQKELMENLTDDSILAWGLALTAEGHDTGDRMTPVYGNILASSPADFADSEAVVCRGNPESTIEKSGLLHGFLHVSLPLHKADGQTFGLLDCRPSHDNKALIGVPLTRVSPGTGSGDYMRPVGSKVTTISAPHLETNRTSIRICEPERFKEAPTYNRRYGFRIDLPSTGELEVVDTHPQNRWEQGKRGNPFIFSGVDFQVDSVQTTWIRFRCVKLPPDPSFPDSRDIASERLAKIQPDSESSSHQHQTSSSLLTESPEPQATLQPSLQTIISRYMTARGIPAKTPDTPAREQTIKPTDLSASTSLRDVSMSQDFLMVLELEVKDSQPEARCHIMTLSRSTALDAIIDIPDLLKHILGRSTASNGFLELEVGLTQDGMANQHVFAVNLSARTAHQLIPHNCDATVELKLIEYTQTLRSVFKEDKQMRPKMKKIPKSIDAITASISSKNTRIDLVDKERDQLQREIEELQKRIGQLEDEKKGLFDVLGRELDQIYSLSQESKTLLEREAEIEEIILLSRGLPNSVGKQRASQWYEEMLDYFSDTLFTAWKLDNELCSIQERNRKIFMQAADRGCLAIMKFLIDGMDNLLFEDDIGYCLLTRAIKNSPTAAEWLIKETNIDVGHISSLGVPSLAMAASMGRVTIARLLLDRGQPVDINSDKNLSTPLSKAALNGQTEVLRLLLARGANVEGDPQVADAESFFWSPLTAAAFRGRVECLQLLLDSGANLEGRNNFGETALVCAAFSGLPHVAQLLLDKNANIESRSHSGAAALTLAAKKGHLMTVQLLLDRGADIRSRNNDGLDALAEAASGGHDQLVTILLDRGASIESKTALNQTPLVLAVTKGHEAVVELLLRRGASTDAKDKDGQTAFFWATRIKNCNIMRLLLDHAAGVAPLQKTPDGNEETRRADTNSDRKPGEFILTSDVCKVQEIIANTNPRLSASDHQVPANTNTTLAPPRLSIRPRARLKVQDLVNTYRNDGNYAIHQAVEHGHLEAVRLLVDSKAHVWVRNRRLQTPLALASSLLRDPEKKNEMPVLENIVALLESVLPDPHTSGSSTVKKRWWKS